MLCKRVGGRPLGAHTYLGTYAQGKRENSMENYHSPSPLRHRHVDGSRWTGINFKLPHDEKKWKVSRRKWSYLMIYVVNIRKWNIWESRVTGRATTGLLQFPVEWRSLSVWSSHDWTFTITIFQSTLLHCETIIFQGQSKADRNNVTSKVRSWT